VLKSLFHHGAARKHVLFPAARKNKLPEKAPVMFNITDEACSDVCACAAAFARCVPDNVSTTPGSPSLCAVREPPARGGTSRGAANQVPRGEALAINRNRETGHGCAYVREGVSRICRFHRQQSRQIGFQMCVNKFQKFTVKWVIPNYIFKSALIGAFPITSK